MSEENASPFSLKTVVILILAGLVGFAAFLLLAAYAPDLRSGRDGRAHGLSTSAIGFRGAYDLLDATGAEVDYVRSDTYLEYGGLTIITLEPDVDQDRLDELIGHGRYNPTLIVLPKWVTAAVPMESDRVYGIAPSLGRRVQNMLTNIGGVTVSEGDARAGESLYATHLGDIRFAAPDNVQSVSGKNLSPLLWTSGGDTILATVSGTQTYVLADPDLLNNQMLDSPEGARSALGLLNYLNTDDGPYRFELVANGFGGTRNMLTLAFEPPFLALTLCIIAAAILAGLQAAFRFGPAQREPRAIAFGKRALVDNSAELLRLARREHLSSGRYVEMTREAAVAAIGNPRQLEGRALDQWLDGFGDKDSEPFSVLVSRAERAKSRQDILNAAQALYQWRKAVTHEC